jgi:hypothetical protein
MTGKISVYNLHRLVFLKRRNKTQESRNEFRGKENCKKLQPGRIFPAESNRNRERENILPEFGMIEAQIARTDLNAGACGR